MYLKEISPGVFVPTGTPEQLLLAVCPCCGVARVAAHNKYRDRCVECGKLYSLYSMRRSCRKKGTITVSAAKQHLELLLKLQTKRNEGFVVPTTLDEEITETTTIVKNAEALEQAAYEALPKIQIVCKHCATELCVPKGTSTGLCTECAEYYERYKRLRGAVPTLSVDDCEVLVDIISRYIRLGKKGIISLPHFNGVIPKLQRRMKELGMDAVKFYGAK